MCLESLGTSAEEGSSSRNPILYLFHKPPAAASNVGEIFQNFPQEGLMRVDGWVPLPPRRGDGVHVLPIYLYPGDTLEASG